MPGPHRPTPPPVALLIALSLLLAALVAGCGTKVGDECDSNYDCADRRLVCDHNVDDGYCLQVGCWENRDCPEDAVCVAFPNGDNFCLLGCDDEGDCRSALSCIDDLPGQPSFCYVR